MKDFYYSYIRENWWFIGLTIVALFLLITAFFVPPTAVIDASVIGATGEIFAFAALGTLIKAIDKGKKATIARGSTTLTVGDVEQPEPNNIEEEEI